MATPKQSYQSWIFSLPPAHSPVHHPTTITRQAPEQVSFHQLSASTEQLLNTKAYPLTFGPGAPASWPYVSLRQALDAIVNPAVGFATVLQSKQTPIFFGASASRLLTAPHVGASTAARLGDVLLGATVVYSTAASAVSKTALCAAYHGEDHQIVATLATKAASGASFKLAFVHHIAPGHTVGAEVMCPVETGRATATTAPGFALGYARELGDGGVAKCRWDDRGELSIKCTLVLAGGDTLGVVVQGNTADLSQPLKYGVSLSLDGQQWPWARWRAALGAPAAAGDAQRTQLTATV